MTNNLKQGDSKYIPSVAVNQKKLPVWFGFSPPPAAAYNRSSLQRGWRYGHGLNKAEGTGEQ